MSHELREVSIRVTVAIKADGHAEEEAIRFRSRATREEAQALVRAIVQLSRPHDTFDEGEEARTPIHPS